MLVCILEYRLVLRSPDLISGQHKQVNQSNELQISENLKLSNNLEVAMEIDDLQVISFDRF